MKSCIFTILVLLHWYICLCVCISLIKPIIDVPRKPSWKGQILMWTCFLHLGVYPRLLRNLSEKLCFEPSQIATVTNCDNSGIPAVAICDLSQFVIKAVTAQTESLSPIKLNTFSEYFAEYPGSLLTLIWKVAFFAHFGVISLVYLLMCRHISYKVIIDEPRKPSWKGPILMWTCFLNLGVYPRLLWNLSEKLCFEPSQIATVTNCDNSGIPAVAICDLSQFVIKAVTAQTDSNNTENVFWVLGRVPRFTFDMNMKSCIFAHFGVISLVYMFMCMFMSYKAHNRCTQETFLKGSDVDVNMFSALRSIPSVTVKSLREVMFWTVTNCDSHKLPQCRNPCRRNLWFVAICGQGRDGTNWVQ